METSYKDIKEVKKIMENLFPTYWERSFHRVTDNTVIKENGVKISAKSKKYDIEKLKKRIKEWENEIEVYSDQLKQYLDLELFDQCNPDAYEPLEFKQDILSTQLWTVKSALKSQDPDLKLYKSHFYEATPMDVFVTTENILNGAEDYMMNIAPNINLKQVSSEEELKLDFLEEDGMLLTGVIGLGIRSEMLHKLYPSHFGIMTRRSLWGMFYLSNESDEFVVDEENELGQQRTSSNWEYDYQRFVFLNNFIVNLIESALLQCDIQIKQNLRFGYANEFLNAISSQHSDQVRVHHTWR